MTRTIWTGYISFGLVNIPIKLFSATSERNINFDLLHEEDLSPIRYAKMCKAEGKEVPYDQIVRGFEYEKDRYVVMSAEEIEKANIGVTKAITITDFVQKEEIDPAYYEKPYYLEADKGGEKPYLLLHQALARSGKVGIGRYVLRNREHLIMLVPDADILVLNQLRFPEEIKDKSIVKMISGISIAEGEIEMALTLINELTGHFQPEKYHDTYNQELRRVIDEKISGKVPAVKGTAPQATQVPDLMKILKESLERERKKKVGTR